MYSQASLNYIDNPELTQMTKLKIFFNAAALYHDLGHNYIKAKNYYAQVLEICKEINDEDYCNRTSIRSIRITLELGDKILAAQEADELALKINIDSKTGVHFLLLRSKISFALNNYDDSYFYAYRA